jgi:tetratricopeptide (TPR) repeat protein
MLNELTPQQVQTFHDDGFLVVENFIPPAVAARVAARYEGLFRGEFETGLYPDEWNWKEAETELRRAIELNINDTMGHAHYSELLIALARFPEAKAEIQKARELDPLSYYVSGIHAWILYMAGEYPAALEQWKSTLNPTSPDAQSVWGLAATYEAMGRSDEAQDPGDRALAIAESADNALLRHQARDQLARLHHDRGNYRQAAAALRESLSALEVAEASSISSISSGVTPVAMQGTTYLAWSLAELGEFAEATHRTEESLRRAQAMENPFALIMACMGVGMVHLRQGNAPAAMPVLEQGLQVCYTFGFTALVFHGIAASLGAAYALANRTADAIPLLRKVADQSASMKLVSDHLLGAIPLGEVWLSTGRIEDAAQVGNQSLDLARKHKQGGHEVYARRLLGEVAARRDPADVQEAEAYYRSAMGLAQELGMRPLSARCHLGLGRLYRRTGQRQESQEHLAIAATMYREMDMRFWLDQAEGEQSAW